MKSVKAPRKPDKLTPAEQERLLQKSKETDAYAKKAFSHLRPSKAA